ncbi:hypothetical protein K1719_011912 [Acacia pycnantha]|nr:hypothetical protein K1719_011912 [Acacia pycnantha]
MEGGVPHDVNTSAFRECLSLSWKNPYILQLAFSAGIDSLLYRYDTDSQGEANSPQQPLQHPINCLSVNKSATNAEETFGPWMLINRWTNRP